MICFIPVHFKAGGEQSPPCADARSSEMCQRIAGFSRSCRSDESFEGGGLAIWVGRWNEAKPEERWPRSTRRSVAQNDAAGMACFYAVGDRQR